MKKTCIAVIIMSFALFPSCTKEKAKLSGRIVGSDSVKLYLERILPGNQSVVDSTVTDGIGAFKFKVRLPEGQPTFYNLRSGNESVALIISPGEKVKIHSIGSMSRNYTVEGSPESERVREVRDILLKGASKLDSILNVYGFTFDEERKKEISQDYVRAYNAVKQAQIKFIVTDPGSLASLYALYQRLPNDYALFNGEADIIYYRQVADSTEKKYPGSPYVRALQKEITSMESSESMAKYLSEQLAQGAVGYPDLVMPDMYGKKHKLSDLEGKVILVDFWSAVSADATLNNAEMKDIYAKYQSEGFEIYQISVDETPSKPVWVNAVQQQKLPWISVCDFMGTSSAAVRSYNVTKLPANFLIDRKGDIVDKDLYGGKLESRVRQLLQ